MSPPPPALERYDDLAPLQADWERLDEQACNPFLSWDWASLWWQTRGAGRRLVVGAARHPDGRLRCVVPLFLTRRPPLRLLRFVGHTCGDVLGPVRARGDDAFAAGVLRTLLASTPGWDVLLAERVPEDEDWPALLDGRLLSEEPCPELEHTGGWSSFLAQRSRNFRQQVGGRQRRLQAEHDVVYRLADAHSLEDDLGALFRLHTARWGGDTPFTAERAFHEAFARRALARGRLRLWVLEVDGRPAAAVHALRAGGEEWYYQSGRDPALDHLAVGGVLFAHAVGAALDEGVVRYRMLRGGEGYKLRYATSTPQLQTVAVARGRLGRVALTAAGLAGPDRLRAAARAARLT